MPRLVPAQLFPPLSLPTPYPAWEAGLACPLFLHRHQHSCEPAFPSALCTGKRNLSRRGLCLLTNPLLWTLDIPAAPARVFTTWPCPPSPPVPSCNAGWVPRHPRGAAWLPGWALPSWRGEHISGQGVLGWHGHAWGTNKAGLWGPWPAIPIYSAAPASCQGPSLATSQP